jgi:hypothetical protein
MEDPNSDVDFCDCQNTLGSVPLQRRSGTEYLAKNARRRQRRDSSALIETSIVEFRQQLQRVRLRLVMIDK